MSNKKFLLKQKSKILAEQNGWSTDYAEGYLQGEYHCRSGKPLGAYVRVGIDEYTSGFRAGYFGRKNPGSAQLQALNAPKIESKLQSK
jgi:hypothetical protein